MSETYVVFKAANLPGETARGAAETVAYTAQFASLETQIERLFHELRLIQWMLTLVIGGVASLVINASF